MSGSFVHNNKVESATAGGCMRMNTSRTVPGGRPSFWEHSFIRRLRYDHNYATGVFGKLLNDMKTYGCDGNEPTTPHGLDRTFIMCNPAFFNENWANYTTSGGSVIHTGSEPADYTTSLVGNTSLEWIKSIVSQGKDHPPFFAYLGPHAPHLPSTPAPWCKCRAPFASASKTSKKPLHRCRPPDRPDARAERPGLQLQRQGDARLPARGADH